ncbi:ATP-dependent RNA helicase DEAH12, chloroplastic [Caerostris extrusa]|uniref:ATP-dependent RNA helicase DEAH12, chloroplastic n=1 Tax=Caerostris extrusa TaxID=172846 RepID=A0AAV4SVN1_CAEEX|nr:ATP-dependent RNA helicase DEAH12, chloroplastic [Caerostris extrusa]
MDAYGLNVNLAGFEALPLIEFGISPIGKTILLHDIMGKARRICIAKKEVFTAVVEQIAEALKFFKENSNAGNTLEIEAFPKEEIVQIKITGNNISDITNSRKSILNFLLGEEFKCSDNTVSEKLFSMAGQAYIKKISEANSKCHIEMNLQKKVLKIFGVLRELLNKYGFDLEKLKTYCGLTSIELNSHQHILRVTGSNIAVTNCQQVIQDIKMELGDTVYDENTELCPVCFDKISNDFHRLEYCGHAYCRECILHWLQISDDFPLYCLTCESPLCGTGHLLGY